MENKLVGMAGDFRAQANKAIDNLKLALADAGATIKDVVKINNYLVDMSHIAIFREVRDQHFNMSAPPASTTVAISQPAGTPVRRVDAIERGAPIGVRLRAIGRWSGKRIEA